MSVPDLAHSAAIRRVVILGHTGFIGGNLYRLFQSAPPPGAPIELVGRDFPDVDLTQPAGVERLGEVFDSHTAVIVCAAIKRQLGDNLDTFAKNLQIIVNVCRALARFPVKRVIYFSSAAVYGEDVNNCAITEQTPPQPGSYYGLAKFTSEVLLRKTIAQSQASSLVLLRPALIYGPGDQGGYGPTGFLKSALAHEPVTLWGDGMELREFVYVGDVARIVHALAFNPYDGVVNVVSGRSYTFRDALAIAERLVPGQQPPGSKPRSKPKADAGFDNSLLRSLVPEVRFTSLEDGMRQACGALAQSSAGGREEKR